MQYMPTTPQAKCKGDNNRLAITKQAFGKGSNKPVHRDKSEYLIILDYHSRFFEVAKLSDTKSNTVITYIKSAFARVMECHLR